MVEKPSIDRMLKAVWEGIQWLDRARKKLVNRAEEFGQEQNKLEKFHSALSNIKEDESVPDLPEVLAEYIESRSEYLRSMDPEDPTSYWHIPIITTSGSPIMATATTTTLDADFDAIVTLPGLSHIYQEIERVSSEHGERKRVLTWLHELDESIAAEFAQAWQTWFAGTEDPARGAAFPMREAVRHTVDLLVSVAPDEVKNGYMSEKTEWIANNLLMRSAAKDIIIKAVGLYRDIYENLSKAHKAGRLERRQVNAYLLEAQAFLLDLANHVDLAKFRQMRSGCA